MHKYFSSIGAIAFVIGLGGIESACEGQGSFMISAIVFSIGFGISLAGLLRTRA